MSEMMKAVRLHKAGAELLVESIPVPEPGPGEVLVRMDSAPINPSDLASISGNYLAASWPFTPGLEGSGIIVKAGKGLLPRMRLGKKVACSPHTGEDGTWAEYMKTSVMNTVPLPGELDMEQGSMLLVNPMTAMAFISLVKKGKHPAFVNNAAASSLGKMLIRLALKESIPLISVVRKEQQIKELKQLGATHVLNSSSASFEEELRSLASELGATLFLDAVTGTETGRLLAAAPEGSTLVAYARLSGDPIQANPSDLIRLNKNIAGFQLGNWLSGKSIPFKLRFLGQVKKEMKGALSSRIHTRFPMEEVNEAIALYKDKMSAGKVLLRLKE